MPAEHVRLLPRVLYVTNETPSRSGGGGPVRDFHLLSRLADQYSFTVVCFTDGQEDLDKAEALRAFCEQVVLIERPSGPKTRWGLRLRTACSIFHPTPMGVRLYTPAAMMNAVHGLCCRYRYDLAYVELTRMAQLLEDFRDGPVLIGIEVVTPKLERNLALSRGLLTKVASYAELWKMRRYERHQYKRARLCLMVSREECNNALTLQPAARVAVVPNGVDTEFFARNESRGCVSESHMIAFLGSMSYPPNIDAVFWFHDHIWPAIQEQDTAAMWVIVGRNPPSEVQQLASAKVLVTGWVEDVQQWLHRSTLMVVPLRSGSGTRLKILEAMAAGLPVVSTTIGAEGLEVTHGENILLADTPTAFAGAVIRLLEDADLADRLRENGRRLVEERYDWRMIAERLDAAFRQALAGRA